MPPEPKKPIEELLEASAQMRRAEFGADPQMPNPMRARLQDEIATLARSAEPNPCSRWFAISWPRLALGAAFASLILGASAIWWQTRQSSQAGARYVRQDQPSSRQMMMAPAELDKLADAKAASENQRPLQSLSEAASHPGSAATDSVAQKSEGAAATLTQQFSQSARNAKVQQYPKVLITFKVEQNGRDFRVVDHDGPTYSGRIERLTPNDAPNLLKQKSSAAVAAAPAAAGRSKASHKAPENKLYFRVTGYNDSLKKSLVFEGTYLPTASQPPRKDRDAAIARSGEQLAARIVGTVTVPGEPSIPVDAVTVPSK